MWASARDIDHRVGFASGGSSLFWQPCTHARLARMRRSTLARIAAAISRGIAYVGSIAAVMIALFIGSPEKLAVTAYVLGGGALWWALWAGLGWFLYRYAERRREYAMRYCLGGPHSR